MFLFYYICTKFSFFIYKNDKSDYKGNAAANLQYLNRERSQNMILFNVRISGSYDATMCKVFPLKAVSQCI